MHEQGKNIFTIFDDILNKADKEKLLQQKSLVIWMTGLSGSGKSTIANALERKLYKEGFKTMLLDGDNIRAGINNNLDFSEEGRKENIRRIAEINKLFLDSGTITINCFVSPSKEMRNLARNIIGTDNFAEIFINTPLEVCEQRDVKGLYKKAREGKIQNFTGINAPFEKPEKPDLDLHTENRSIEESVNELYNYIKPLISYK